jgi:5-methylcytosine-specific restriction endonuclease McrA
VARISITHGFAARVRRFVRARDRRDVFRRRGQAKKHYADRGDQRTNRGDQRTDLGDDGSYIGEGCQFESAITGIRCGSRYQLQVDHIVSLADGGSNDVENLQTLCRAHNLLKAETARNARRPSIANA